MKYKYTLFIINITLLLTMPVSPRSIFNFFSGSQKKVEKKDENPLQTESLKVKKESLPPQGAYYKVNIWYDENILFNEGILPQAEDSGKIVFDGLPEKTSIGDLKTKILEYFRSRKSPLREPDIYLINPTHALDAPNFKPTNKVNLKNEITLASLKADRGYFNFNFYYLLNGTEKPQELITIVLNDKEESILTLPSVADDTAEIVVKRLIDVIEKYYPTVNTTTMASLYPSNEKDPIILSTPRKLIGPGIYGLNSPVPQKFLNPTLHDFIQGRVENFFEYKNRMEKLLIEVCSSMPKTLFLQDSLQKSSSEVIEKLVEFSQKFLQVYFLMNAHKGGAISSTYQFLYKEKLRRQLIHFRNAAESIQKIIKSNENSPEFSERFRIDLSNRIVAALIPPYSQQQPPLYNPRTIKIIENETGGYSETIKQYFSPCQKEIYKKCFFLAFLATDFIINFFYDKNSVPPKPLKELYNFLSLKKDLFLATVPIAIYHGKKDIKELFDDFVGTVLKPQEIFYPQTLNTRQNSFSPKVLPAVVQVEQKTLASEENFFSENELDQWRSVRKRSTTISNPSTPRVASPQISSSSSSTSQSPSPTKNLTDQPKNGTTSSASPKGRRLSLFEALSGATANGQSPLNLELLQKNSPPSAGSQAPSPNPLSSHNPPQLPPPLLLPPGGIEVVKNGFSTGK